jgi:hypothetical protein
MYFRKITHILCALSLAGCAAAPAKKEVSILMDKKTMEILQCVGPPHRETQSDGLRFWTYKYEDVTPQATWNCELRLVIKDGIVTKVDTHSTVENIFGASRSLCKNAVKKC